MGRAVRILRAVFHDMHMPEMAMKNAGGQGDKGKEFNPMRSIAVAGGAGMTLLSCIGLGIWGGLKCDEYLGTYPFGLIGLSLLGALFGKVFPLFISPILVYIHTFLNFSSNLSNCILDFAY